MAATGAPTPKRGNRSTIYWFDNFPQKCRIYFRKHGVSNDNLREKMNALGKGYGINCTKNQMTRTWRSLCSLKGRPVDKSFVEIMRKAFLCIVEEDINDKIRDGKLSRSDGEYLLKQAEADFDKCVKDARYTIPTSTFGVARANPDFENCMQPILAEITNVYGNPHRFFADSGAYMTWNHAYRVARRLHACIDQHGYAEGFGISSAQDLIVSESDDEKCHAQVYYMVLYS